MKRKQHHNMMLEPLGRVWYSAHRECPSPIASPIWIAGQNQSECSQTFQACSRTRTSWQFSAGSAGIPSATISVCLISISSPLRPLHPRLRKSRRTFYPYGLGSRSVSPHLVPMRLKMPWCRSCSSSVPVHRRPGPTYPPLLSGRLPEESLSHARPAKLYGYSPAIIFLVLHSLLAP